MANVLDLEFELPVKNHEIDYEIMENFITELEKNYKESIIIRSEENIKAYLNIA
ncbi:hypothetical protein IKN40_09385 [bacterium]|nr:hypothetical protein [bacterium]